MFDLKTKKRHDSYMSGKTFKISTGESETGAQNEPLPDVNPPAEDVPVEDKPTESTEHNE